MGETEARELYLYIQNDGNLYRQQGLPIIKNLVAKIDRGIYDRQKAIKLYMYLMESGAKKYVKEFGGTWNLIFDKASRELAAKNFVHYFETEYKLGAFNELHAKKYQKTRGMLKNPRPRKYIEVYIVQGNYGQGWEDLISETSWKEAKTRLHEYNENERGYAHRRITRKVKIEDYEKGNF